MTNLPNVAPCCWRLNSESTVLIVGYTLGLKPSYRYRIFSCVWVPVIVILNKKPEIIMIPVFSVYVCDTMRAIMCVRPSHGLGNKFSMFAPKCVFYARTFKRH